MDNKILIITYDMIPYSSAWGGCQRMYYLGEYLNKNGMDVHMISAKKKYTGDFGKSINFKVNYVSREKEYEFSKIKDFTRKVLRRLTKKYFNDHSGFSLEASIWLRNNEKEIFEYIKKNHIEKVIVSGPPFYLYSIIEKIKKFIPKIKIILDFRDPWNTWNNNEGLPFKRERKLLNISDKIIVATENVMKEKITKFHISEGKISTIYNGYSQEDWDGVTRKETVNNRIKFNYLGAIDFNPKGYRDLTNFFLAYDMLKENKKFFEVKFIGITESRFSNELKAKYTEISFETKVSPSEALNKMVESDVLLNVHTYDDKSAELLISGKIFDYIKSDKIIFSISSKTSLVSKLIKENKFGLAVENDVMDIYKNLNLLIDEFKNERLMELRNHDKEILSRFSREFQNENYLKIIKDL